MMVLRHAYEKLTYTRTSSTLPNLTTWAGLSEHVQNAVSRVAFVRPAILHFLRGYGLTTG